MSGTDMYKWAREYRTPDSQILTFPLIIMIVTVIILVLIVSLIIYKNYETELPSVVYVRPVPFL